MSSSERRIFLGDTGKSVAELHDDLGALGLDVPDDEKGSAKYGEKTKALVRRFQKDCGIAETGVVDDETSDALSASLAPFQVVRGRLTSNRTTAVGGVQVIAVDRGIGDASRELGEAMSRPNGKFTIRLKSRRTESGRSGIDLQVIATRGGEVLGESPVFVNAQEANNIDVPLRRDRKSADVEYGALDASIRESFGGEFRDLRENEQNPDLTVLSRRTGWDARAVAMMSQADVLTETTGLDRALTYALLRSGVPADADKLAQLTTTSLVQVWKSAAEHEIIKPQSEKQIAKAVKTFKRFRSGHAGSVRIFQGGDNLDDVLSVSKLDNKIHDALLGRIADTEGRVWQDMDKWLKKYEPDAASRAAIQKRLQLDSGLFRLTQGNASLMSALHKHINDFEMPQQLLQAGFFRHNTWSDLIDPDKIPGTIPGETPEERRDAYAHFMAATVDVMWPTGVVAAKLLDQDDPLELPNVSKKIATEVGDFLGNIERGFELGMHPFSDYQRRHKTGLSDEAATEILKLQRLWQLTEENETLTLILTTNIGSAREIAMQSRIDFVTSYSQALKGESRAMTVYDRARQVHATTVALTHVYLKEKYTPTMGNLMGELVAVAPPADQPAAQATLETLFGSLDACACEHCQSILSPAAYLVDVFSFIDRPNSQTNPLDRLFARRPDLQHIPLSCKNTNMAMPLVDFSNEILQHIVGSGEVDLANYRGFDTPDDASNEDLRAAPQFEDIPVANQADDNLATTFYPPPLPYVRNLDKLRTTLNELSVALHVAMRAYRAHDNLDAGGAAYAWRDIRLEQAGLDRAVHRLLATADLNLADHYGYPPATGDAAVRNALTPVQAFIRRSKIEYQDLIDMLGLRYLNPAIGPGLGFSALGIRFSAVRDLKNGDINEAEFRAMLNADLDESTYGNDVVAWLNDDARFNALTTIIALSNPDDPDGLCELDKLQLSRLAADPADSQVLRGGFVRLARFIRLWRRLEWSMSDIDAALWSLLPDNAKPDGIDDPNLEAQMADGFDEALIGLGAVHKVLDLMSLKAKRDLRSLLVLWAPIDSLGPDSLYARLFLQHPGVDPTFLPDADGRVLTSGSAISNHTEAVRGALRISGDDWTTLVEVLGINIADPLTIEVVSALYRYAWLARALRISVQELFALIDATNLDPFTAPTDARPDLLTFVEFVKSIKASKLKLHTALYLIWDMDLRRQAAPDANEAQTFAVQLRNDLRTAVEGLDTENVEDANMLAVLSSVYDSEDAAFFHSLLTSTFTVDASYQHGGPDLPQPVLDAANGALAYDDVRKQLVHTGFVMANQRDAIVNAGNNEGLGQPFVDAVDALRTESVTSTDRFFENHPDLRDAFTDYLNNGADEVARRTLMNSLAGSLARARMQSQAIATITGYVRSPIELGELLLLDAAAFHANRAPAGDPVPAIEDLIAITNDGLTAEFWFGAINQNPDVVRDATEVDHVDGEINELPDNGGNDINGRWRGGIVSETEGPHEFVIETDVGAQVKLEIDGNAIPLTEEAQGRWVTDVAVELSSSTPSFIVLEVGNVRNQVRLLWRSSGTTRSGRQVVPGVYLFSEVHTDNLVATIVRFRKMAMLAQTLGLTPGGAHWLAANPERTIAGRGWIHAFGTTADGGGDDRLVPVLSDLLQFSRLRDSFPDTDIGLLAHLRAPDAADAEGPLLDRQMVWPTVDIDALLAHLGIARGQLNDLTRLDRLVTAMELASTIGVSARVLIDSLTNDPNARQAQRFLDALRARYDDRAWRDLIQPVNDDLRRRRRDALIASTLHLFSHSNVDLRKIDTAEKLYEHLLIDVSSDPCFPTSRVRQAMSAAQQFVDRIEQSAEPDISPDVIDHKQWEFMNRYRVWEVVRKLLIEGENYMVPDLYDIPSPEFTSTIKELSQGDITDDAAAIAFTKYLNSLERIARLEPVALCEETKPSGSEILHVISRTLGRDKKWYYRRFAYGSWTPFAPIDADIEGDPVLPVVWQGRIFAFWLRITKEAVEQGGLSNINTSNTTPLQDVTRGQLGQEAKTRSSNQKERVYASLAFSEYADGVWTSPKSSDPDTPSWMGDFPLDGWRRFRRRDLLLETKVHPGNTLYVTVVGALARFKLYRPHSDPEVDAISDGKAPYLLRHFSSWNNDLVARYAQKGQGHGYYHMVERQLIHGDHPFRVTQMPRWRSRPWMSPFFVADRQHVYLVRTSAKPWRAFSPIPVDWWKPEVVKSVFTDMILERIPSTLIPELDPRLGDGIPVPELKDPLVVGDHLRIVFNSGVPFDLDGTPIGPNGGIRN